MSGMGMQLAILGGVLVLLILFVIGLRRLSERSRKHMASSVQERLGVGREHEEAAKPRRHREKPRPAAARPAKPEPKKKAKPEPEERDDDEDDVDDAPAGERAARPAKASDPEAEAAYREGLAKTRGGFVAKLGKLFGKKKIDASLLEELEQVLFTADIGPRAADRIFQAVKTGLSKDDLEDADKVWAKIRATSNDILDLDAPAV